MTRISIITTTFILAALTSFGQTPNKIVHTVEWDYLEGCETGIGECKPVTLIRETLKDSIKVIFPSGGTQSDVYLYSLDSKVAIRHDQKHFEQGNPTLDLTGLPDGKYSASMLSCGLGGGFSLTIKTLQR